MSYVQHSSKKQKQQLYGQRAQNDPGGPHFLHPNNERVEQNDLIGTFQL